MKKFIVICLVSWMLITPQQLPFAKTLAPQRTEVSVDTSTLDKLFIYKKLNYEKLRATVDTIRSDNSKRLIHIQYKIDSIFHH